MTKEKIELLLQYLEFNNEKYLVESIKKLLELDKVNLYYNKKAFDNKLFREAIFYHLYHNSVKLIDKITDNNREKFNIKNDFISDENICFRENELNVSYIQNNDSVPVFKISRSKSKTNNFMNNNLITISLYETLLNLESRQKLIEDFSKRYVSDDDRLIRFNKETIEKLKNRSDNLPQELVEAVKYQKEFSNKFLELYNIKEEELILPSHIEKIETKREYYQPLMGAPEEYISTYIVETVYDERNNNYGKTLVKKYPNNRNVNIRIEKNIEYY